MSGLRLFSLGGNDISSNSNHNTLSDLTSIGTSIIKGLGSTLSLGTTTGTSAGDSIITLSGASPAKLTMDGHLSAKNPGWILDWSGTEGNQQFNSDDILFSGQSKSKYFNRVTTFNEANSNAWDGSTSSTSGIFTIPSKGLYIITLNAFINGFTAGRIFSFDHLDSGNSVIDLQLLDYSLDISSSTAENGRVMTINRIFNTGEKFRFKCKTGSVTLYMAGYTTGHTNVHVYKVN